jgi:2-methylcitrate dehydratase PrpD
VGRALLNRSVKLEHFEGEAHFDPAIRALLPRIEARAHPDMPADSPMQWGAEVVVFTTDGQRLASRLDDYPSRGPGGVPMTREELWTKFSDCGARALPRGQLPPLFEKLAAIETVPRVADLTALLARPGAASRAA